MLEPALILDDTMTVGETLDYLREYPRFKYSVVRHHAHGEVRWFVMAIDQIRWLVKDGDPTETLRGALELEEVPESEVHDTAIGPMPDVFVGVVLAEGAVLGVAAAE